MDNEWIAIFSTSDEFDAELAKGLLKENEIDYVVVNKKDSSIHFGEIELFVMRKNALRAKYLIKNL